MRTTLSTVCAALAALLSFAPGARAAVSWSEVQLTDAAGVPGEAVHGYWFKGILVVWHQKSSTSVELDLTVPPVQPVSHTGGVVDATIWVQGKGKWNEKTNEAEESLEFQGDVTGGFVSRLKCTRDPWLQPASCTVLSAQHEASKGKAYDWTGMVHRSRQPLTRPAVTLALAEKLSQQHKGSVPPPPPPPVPKAEEPKRLSTPLKQKTPATMGGGLVRAPPQTAPTVTPSAGGSPAAVAKAVTPGALPTGLPDIASAPSLTIGTRPVNWGDVLSVNATEARRVHGGLCEFAVRHTARNAGLGAAAASHRRWTNSGAPGQWDMSYPPIPAGGFVERVDTLPLAPGRNVLYLTLDSANGVAESNENNNLYRVAVDVNGSCQPVLAPVAPSGRR